MKAQKRKAPLHMKTPPAWLKKGARVDYHAVIGREVTQAGMTVKDDPMELPGQGAKGASQWVVFLEGKSGWVAIEAVTLAAEPAP